MAEPSRYISTNLTGFLSVRSIVCVLNADMSDRDGAGESHDFPELMYVNAGSHTLKIDGVSYVMEPGQLIVYAPHAYHEGDLPSDANLSIISFEAELPEQFPFYNRVITLTGKQQQFLRQIIAGGMEALQAAPAELGLTGMIPRPDTPDYVLQQLKNQLELFLIDLYQTAEPKRPKAVPSNHENLRDEQFRQVLAFLNANLKQNLTLEQIANGCAMSIPKLKALCKARCGCGPITYFISLKISTAKTLIRDSSMSFTQIAQELGFHSIHYFSKLFKEKTGMTPSEYAKGLNKQ